MWCHLGAEELLFKPTFVSLKQKTTKFNLILLDREHLLKGRAQVQQNPLSYSLDIANIIYKAIYPNEGKHTSLLYNSINY